MDFRPLAYETACVPNLLHILRRLRAVPTGAMAMCALSLAACDAVKGKLYPEVVDRGWQSDSTLLAASPAVLMRVVRSKEGTRAVPLATIDGTGVHTLSLTPRGWRALDVQMLHEGRRFVPYRGSEPLGTIVSRRGMWEGPTLDSLPGCSQMLPAAAVSVPDGVELLTSGSTALPGRSNGLANGELERVLSVVSTLVAPSAGVPMSKMSRYRRTVQVVGTGATASPTIVVTYSDPQELPAGASRMAERPRQLVLVLDKGAYGYRPSLTLADVSAARLAPRRRFLGALDTNGDGRAELFFGLGENIERGELATFSYRFSGDAWIADWEYRRTRCMG